MINYRLLGGLIHLRNPPIGAGLRCMHFNNDRFYENDYEGDFCRHRLSTLPRGQTRYKAPPCSVSDPPVSKFQPSLLPHVPKTDKVAAYSSKTKNDPPIDEDPKEPESAQDENSDAQCIINIYMDGQNGKKSYSTTVAFKDIDLKPEDIREHIRREKAAAGDVDALPPDDNDGDENKRVSLAKRLENFLLGFFKTSHEPTNDVRESHARHRPYPKLTKDVESTEDMRSIESFVKHSELTAAKWARSEPEMHEHEHEDVWKQSRSLEELREKRAFRARHMFDAQPRLRDEEKYVEKIDRVIRLAMRRPPAKGFRKFMAYWKDMFGTDNISDYSRFKIVKFIDPEKLKGNFRERIGEGPTRSTSSFFGVSKQRIKRLKSLKFLDYKKIFNQEAAVEKTVAKPPPVTDFKVFELSSKGVEDYANRRDMPGLQRKKKSLFENHNASKVRKAGYATDCGQGSKSKSEKDKEAACDKKCDDKMDKVKANVKQLFAEGGKGSKTDAKKTPCGAKPGVESKTTQKSDVASKSTAKKFDLCEGVKIKREDTNVKTESKEKALVGSKASDIFIPSQFLKTFMRLITKMLSLVKRVKPEIKVKGSKQAHKKEFKPKYSCKQVKPDVQGTRSKQSLEKKPPPKGEVSCKDLLKKSKTQISKKSEAEPCEETTEHPRKPTCNQKPCKLKRSADRSDPCAAMESKKSVCKSEKKADPCKAKESKKSVCDDEKKADPCAKKAAKSCAATEPKKSKKADPCKAKESKKSVCEDEKKADPCAKKSSKPCATTESKKSVCKTEKKTDPCKAIERKKSVCKDEKKADPCAKKSAKPCATPESKKTAKKIDPCKATDSKKSVSKDPCAKQSAKESKKSDPCKFAESKKAEKKVDPCATKSQPIEASKPCKPTVSKKSADPCAKKPVTKKPDPCAKQAAKPCKDTESKKSEKKVDPCRKTESKKSDPCKGDKKADPCTKKSAAAAEPIKSACNDEKEQPKGKADPCRKKDEGSGEGKGSQPCKFNVNFNKQCDKVFDVKKAVLKRKKRPCNRNDDKKLDEEEQKSCGDAAKKDPCKKSYHTSQILGEQCADGEGDENKCETQEDVEKISKRVIGATSKCLVQRNPDVDAEPVGYPCPEETKCDNDDPRSQTVVEAREVKQDIMDEIGHLLKHDGVDDVEEYYGKGYKNVDYFKYGKMCFHDLNSFMSRYRSPQPDAHAKKKESL